MKRQFGLHSHATTPFSKAVRNLDDAVSKLVRQHYESLGCFTCPHIATWNNMDCGHFRRRECMNTRFNLYNLGNQCRSCNRFNGGMSYEMGRKLDEIWGLGTAVRMDRESRIIKQWEIKELEQLKSAAKLGWLPYLQLYAELTDSTNVLQLRKGA
jgi:hypothetical protein